MDGWLSQRPPVRHRAARHTQAPGSPWARGRGHSSPVKQTGGLGAVTAPPPPADINRALEQLGSLALREHSMETLLQRVVDLTKIVMPGHPEASISLMTNDKPSTAVF